MYYIISFKPTIVFIFEYTTDIRRSIDCKTYIAHIYIQYVYNFSSSQMLRHFIKLLYILQKLIAFFFELTLL